MSAVMVAGMIPPIMIGLSMLTSSNLYQDDEVKGKWHCMIKGLCFVSEEAIPFMRKVEREFICLVLLLQL